MTNSSSFSVSADDLPVPFYMSLFLFRLEETQGFLCGWCNLLHMGNKPKVFRLMSGPSAAGALELKAHNWFSHGVSNNGDCAKLRACAMAISGPLG